MEVSWWEWRGGFEVAVDVKRRPSVLKGSERLGGKREGDRGIKQMEAVRLRGGCSTAPGILRFQGGKPPSSTPFCHSMHANVRVLYNTLYRCDL